MQLAPAHWMKVLFSFRGEVGKQEFAFGVIAVIVQAAVVGSVLLFGREALGRAPISGGALDPRPTYAFVFLLVAAMALLPLYSIAVLIIKRCRKVGWSAQWAVPILAAVEVVVRRADWLFGGSIPLVAAYGMASLVMLLSLVVLFGEDRIEAPR